MAQCTKRIGNRRCKANSLKGKKTCLFHTKKAVSFRGTRKGNKNRK